MDDRQRHYKDGADNEILFSKTVKAGKRIYYIDVKRDRKGEFYLSMTESKRLKDVNNNALHPTFENIKFFYIARTSKSLWLPLTMRPSSPRPTHPKTDATENGQKRRTASTLPAAKTKLATTSNSMLNFKPLAVWPLGKKYVILHPICPAQA